MNLILNRIAAGIFLCLFLCLVLSLGTRAALALEAVVATVNDHPITGFDVDQRINLLKFMGEARPEKLTRKAAFNSIVEDYIKIDEAKLNKVDPSDREIDDRIDQITKSLKTDDAGLKAKLASVGLTVSALRSMTAAQISMRRIIQVRYHETVKVDPADVDKKMADIKAEINGKVAAIENDPRRRPVNVVQLQEINFPVEGNDPQLLQSRAIEANQVAQKLKSCSGIKEAAAGVFNVKTGRKIEADSQKLPPQMQRQLSKIGIGRALGPMRYAQGIQLLAYCGSRKITPPPVNINLPTRDQVENIAFGEKLQGIEDKYMALMRKNAIIEIKDPAYGP